MKFANYGLRTTFFFLAENCPWRSSGLTKRRRSCHWVVQGPGFWYKKRIIVWLDYVNLQRPHDTVTFSDHELKQRWVCFILFGIKFCTPPPPFKPLSNKRPTKQNFVSLHGGCQSYLAQLVDMYYWKYYGNAALDDISLQRESLQFKVTDSNKEESIEEDEEEEMDVEIFNCLTNASL